MFDRILHPHSRLLATPLLLGLGLTWTCTTFGQTTWYVDDNAVYDPNYPDEDGSPEHPFNQIYKGIDAASDGDTVLVLDGTYYGIGSTPDNFTIDFCGKAIVLRSVNGPDHCIITRLVEGGSFYFHNNETADSVVEGFTITDTFGDTGFGGGIAIDNASPTIINCVITQCSSSNGGGIGCTGGSPTFIDCDIVANYIDINSCSENGMGVACIESNATFIGCVIADNYCNHYPELICYSGVYCNGGAVTFIECIISGHTDGPDGSTGIYADGTDLTFDNCTITNNSGGLVRAGGVYCDGFLIMRNSTVSQNSAGCNAGGIYMRTGIIENSIIEDNRSGGLCFGEGGGIGAFGDLVVDSCQFYHNDSWDGGAIYVRGTIFATNNIFANNHGYSDGADIFCHNAHHPIIDSCTFANSTNLCPSVACYSEHAAEITNCIFWNDRGRMFSGNASVTYCDVQGGCPGVGNIDSDPRFVDPDSLDFHLSPDSPCINAGTNYDPNLPMLDIDGEARVQNCRVDIGADESPHLPPLTDCNTNGTDDDCDIFNGASADDDLDHVPDECMIQPDDPNSAPPDANGDPNEPNDGNAPSGGPDHCGQQPEETDSSLPACGSDACGSDVFGWLPLSILILCFMRASGPHGKSGV